jgi:hypothetical protein
LVTNIIKKENNMQISSNITSTTASANSNSIKTNFTEKISKEEADSIRAQINENTNLFALKSFNVQGKLTTKEVDFEQFYQEFQTFLDDVGYKGKPIGELSQDEASALVSEDGIFGIEQTSQRMADFVINGANGDEDKLRSGREGLLQGYREAEAMWGGELPDISKKTMEAALEMIDKTMADLGYSIINQEV